MKASFVRKAGGPEVIEFGELPTPTPSATQVLVRVKFAGLNHLDLWVRRGLASLKVEYPRILCCDGAGLVEAVGSEVSGFVPGEEVILHPGISCSHCEACLSGWESLCPQYHILGESMDGCGAQYIAVPAANLFRKPKNLSLSAAASIGLTFTTAWQMVVRRANIQPGDRVLIHAAGSGVSSAAIQIARLYKAEIIATAGTEEKLERARSLGALHTINYRQKNFLEEVKRITNKRGVDVIIDHTGKDLWEGNIRALRSGGKIVLCGATSGPNATTNLAHVFFRQLEILGSTMGTKADFPRMLNLVEKGELAPVVDRVFPLEDAPLAHARLEQREQFGKVVLEVP